MKKRTITCLIVMGFLFMLPLSALAHNAELSRGINNESIIEEIVEFASSSIAADEYSLTITENDVDINQAFIFYVDTDIFQIESNDITTLQSNLAAGTYIFEVPIYLEQGTYMAYVAKGLPVSDNARNTLSDAEIAELEKNVGRWSVSSGGFYEGIKKDYVEEVKNAMADNFLSTVLLVGGLPYFRDPVALIPNEEGQIEKLYPLFPDTIDWDQLALTPESDVVVFDYVDLKKHIATLPPITYVNDTSAGGGNGLSYNDGTNTTKDNISAIWLMVLIVAIILVAIVVVRNKKYNSNRKT